MPATPHLAAFNTTNYPSWGVFWPATIPAGHAVCTCDIDAVSDACCLRLQGALYTFNQTMPSVKPYEQPANHRMCLLMPPQLGKANFTAQNEAWSKCVLDTKGVVGGSCSGSGAGKRAALGLAGLVWVAVGLVLAV
ncbi:hypothetical protein Q8F55_001497 [Vanrija albida]|uniref:Extracellular membrane protein CFEM domain-containing protein n=1 Tax=Vanrija albida TaxID=181172 RepID=A0ABR3QG72_9TREE